jgi:hypothetical protein
MIQEHVTEVGNSYIMTESGMKFPTGDRDFTIGQSVWTDGDYVLGRQRWGQSAVFVPQGSKGFFDIISGAIRFNNINTDLSITADNSPLIFPTQEGYWINFILCENDDTIYTFSFSPESSTVIWIKMLTISTGVIRTLANFTLPGYRSIKIISAKNGVVLFQTQYSQNDSVAGVNEFYYQAYSNDSETSIINTFDINEFSNRVTAALNINVDDISALMDQHLTDNNLITTSHAINSAIDSGVYGDWGWGIVEEWGYTGIYGTGLSSCDDPEDGSNIMYFYNDHVMFDTSGDHSCLPFMPAKPWSDWLSWYNSDYNWNLDQNYRMNTWGHQYGIAPTVGYGFDNYTEKDGYLFTTSNIGANYNNVFDNAKGVLNLGGYAQLQTLKYKSASFEYLNPSIYDGVPGSTVSQKSYYTIPLSLQYAVILADTKDPASALTAQETYFSYGTNNVYYYVWGEPEVAGYNWLGFNTKADLNEATGNPDIPYHVYNDETYGGLYTVYKWDAINGFTLLSAYVFSDTVALVEDGNVHRERIASGEISYDAPNSSEDSWKDVQYLNDGYSLVFDGVYGNQQTITLCKNGVTIAAIPTAIAYNFTIWGSGETQYRCFYVLDLADTLYIGVCYNSVMYSYTISTDVWTQVSNFSTNSTRWGHIYNLSSASITKVKALIQSMLNVPNIGE